MPRHAARTSPRETARSSNHYHRPPGRSLYQEITEKIIGQLEAGCVPWSQPWRRAGGPSLGLPKNAATPGGNGPVFAVPPARRRPAVDLV